MLQIKKYINLQFHITMETILKHSIAEKCIYIRFVVKINK